jgi:hypothetical protein
MTRCGKPKFLRPKNGAIMTRLLRFLPVLMLTLNLLPAVSPCMTDCFGHPNRKGDSSYAFSFSKKRKIYVKNNAIKITKNGIVLRINGKALLLNGVFSDKRGLFIRPENIVLKGRHDIVCCHCDRPYDIVRYGNRCPRCGRVQLPNEWENDNDE